jgi:hypothetical protein
MKLQLTNDESSELLPQYQPLVEIRQYDINKIILYKYLFSTAYDRNRIFGLMARIQLRKPMRIILVNSLGLFGAKTQHFFLYLLEIFFSLFHKD